MVTRLRGTVHGRSIELEADPGFEDGERVEVVLTSRALPGPPPGWMAGGPRTAAGMMAEGWTGEDDHILESIERDRHALSNQETSG